MKLNDLSGKRFGRWLVIERSISNRLPGKQRTEWLCRCDCGTTRVIPACNLTRNLSRSCGCSYTIPIEPCPTCGEPVTRKINISSAGRQQYCSVPCSRWGMRSDYLGKRFGRLIVERCIGSRFPKRRGTGGGYLWLCRCDCGKSAIVLSGNLAKGTNSRSCGCLKREVGFRLAQYVHPPKRGKCVECGKEFFGHHNRRVCSHACALAAQRKPIHELSCPICGSPVQRMGDHNKIYCSKNCGRIADIARHDPVASFARVAAELERRLNKE